MNIARTPSYIDPTSKLYGHLDRLALIQSGKVAPPVNVEIDLSNRCSLGCEFCCTRDAILLVYGRGLQSIADVIPGDRVLACDDGGIGWSDVYIHSERVVSGPMYRVTAGQFLIEATAEHPVMTACGWKRMSEITINDEIAHVQSDDFVRMWMRHERRVRGKSISSRPHVFGMGWQGMAATSEGDMCVRVRKASEDSRIDIQARTCQFNAGGRKASEKASSRSAIVRLRLRSTGDAPEINVPPRTQQFTAGVPSSRQRSNEVQKPNAPTRCGCQGSVTPSTYKPETIRNTEANVRGWIEEGGARWRSSETTLFEANEKIESDERQGDRGKGGHHKQSSRKLREVRNEVARAMEGPGVPKGCCRSHEATQSDVLCRNNGKGDGDNSVTGWPIETGAVVRLSVQKQRVADLASRLGCLLGERSESRFQGTRQEVRDRGDGRIPLDGAAAQNSRELWDSDGGSLLDQRIPMSGDHDIGACPSPASGCSLSAEGDSEFLQNWPRWDLAFSTIRHIELITKEETVYNIETSSGTYFANGILTHNCHFAYTHTRGPLAGERGKPSGAIIGGDLMPRQLWTKMLGELSEYGVRSCSLTGGGEPTLHPDFNEIIETIGRTGMDQGIYTHGGHINDARAAIMKRNMAWCYISLDNADRDSYRAYKRIDGFERACHGVINLAQACGKATIGVGFLLMKDNWRDGPKMIDLARSLGADYVQFRPTILYEQSTPNVLTEDVQWMHELIAWIESIDDPFVEADPERFRQYAGWTGHQYKTCYWSGLSTVITPNGKVWECVNKREHAAAEIGDLTRESFASIWERHRPCQVDGTCRLLCRGHVANLELDRLMGLPQRPHGNFI